MASLPNDLITSLSQMRHYRIGQKPSFDWKYNVNDKPLVNHRFRSQYFRSTGLRRLVREKVGNINVEILCDINGSLDLYIDNFDGIHSRNSAIYLKAYIICNLTGRVLKIYKVFRRYNRMDSRTWHFKGSIHQFLRIQRPHKQIWQSFFNENSRKVYSVKAAISIKHSVFR